MEKSTNNEQKCGNCYWAVPRDYLSINDYGFPNKYLECMATDKTKNIYKDKDDICDKGKYKEKV